MRLLRTIMYKLFQYQIDDLRVWFLEKMYWVDVYREPGTVQTHINSYHVLNLKLNHRGHIYSIITDSVFLTLFY